MQVFHNILYPFRKCKNYCSGKGNKLYWTWHTFCINITVVFNWIKILILHTTGTLQFTLLRTAKQHYSWHNEWHSTVQGWNRVRSSRSTGSPIAWIKCVWPTLILHWIMCAIMVSGPDQSNKLCMFDRQWKSISLFSSKYFKGLTYVIRVFWLFTAWILHSLKLLKYIAAI